MATELGDERGHRYADRTEGVEHMLPSDLNEQGGEGDEPGFGLGFPGLAAPSLPYKDMVVPPLNFAMVRSLFRYHICDP